MSPKSWTFSAPGQTITVCALKQLSSKLMVLLCLVSFQRVSDIHAFNSSAVRVSTECVVFSYVRFSTGCVVFSLFRCINVLFPSVSYPYFPLEPALCMACCLQAYLDQTSALRSSCFSQIFISYVRPFRLVSAPSLTHWVRWILFQAEVEESFGAHLVRGAAASLAFSRDSSLRTSYTPLSGRMSLLSIFAPTLRRPFLFCIIVQMQNTKPPVLL